MAEMSMVGLGLGAAGSAISASGTLASGDAAMAAAQYSSSATRTSSELSAIAAENSSELTATAQEETGRLTQMGDEFEAQQLRQNANNTRAQAQRGSFDIQQQTRLALSTLSARVGGSGLSASGATPMSVVGAIGARGTYLALSEMAGGENTARGLEDQATAAHLHGVAAKYGSDLAAAGTRYSGQATAQATRYAGETGSTAALMTGSAAQSAAQSSALGTLASGFGTTLSKAGSIYYPTAARN